MKFYEIRKYLIDVCIAVKDDPQNSLEDDLGQAQGGTATSTLAYVIYLSTFDYACDP